MLKEGMVFVVGAALSSELGLPMGGMLKSRIVSLLPTDRRGGGDGLLRYLAETHGWMSECRTLATALPLASSIDNLIEHRAENEGLVHVAKLAIARAIWKAEADSTIGAHHGSLSSLPTDGSYAALFRLIVNGVPKRDLADAFGRLRIITFNYDRTLEVFLHRALRAYGNLTDGAAQAILDRATILHAYGALSATQEGESGRVISFSGDQDVDQLERDARGLRTFSEKIEDGSDVSLRRLVASARHVVFLGCAFHRQNMNLLESDTANMVSVAGTAYTPPPADPGGHAVPSLESFAGPITEAVKSTMANWYTVAPAPLWHRASCTILPMTCLQLISYLGPTWLD